MEVSGKVLLLLGLHLLVRCLSQVPLFVSQSPLRSLCTKEQSRSPRGNPPRFFLSAALLRFDFGSTNDTSQSGENMKLLTPTIIKNLPRLNSTSGIVNEDKIVICKFLNPIGDGTWYVVEGEKVGNDYHFYGAVEFNTKRWCHFTLSELKKKKLPFGFKIIRDRSYSPRSFSDQS